MNLAIRNCPQPYGNHLWDSKLLIKAGDFWCLFHHNPTASEMSTACKTFLSALGIFFFWEKTLKNWIIPALFMKHMRDLGWEWLALLFAVAWGNSSTRHPFKGPDKIMIPTDTLLICSSGQWLKTQVGCVNSQFLENFIWQIFCSERSCPACQRVLASTMRCRK